jgi:Na+-transporting methylmalonyl-CoA/oxaloacetate decarboxylase gamma subunit
LTTLHVADPRWLIVGIVVGVVFGVLILFASVTRVISCIVQRKENKRNAAKMGERSDEALEEIELQTHAANRTVRK